MELTNHLLKETLLSYVTVSAVDLDAQQPRFCQRGTDEFVFMHDYKSFLFHPDKLVNGMRGDLYIDRFSPARYMARNMRKWFDIALREPFDPRYSGCLRNLRGEALKKTLQNDQTRDLSFLFFEVQEDVYIEFCCIAVAEVAQRVKLQQDKVQKGGPEKTELNLRIEYLVDGEGGSLQLVNAEDDLEMQLATLFSGNEKREVFTVL